MVKFLVSLLISVPWATLLCIAYGITAKLPVFAIGTGSTVIARLFIDMVWPKTEVRYE